MTNPYGMYQQSNFNGTSMGGQFALALEKAAQRVMQMKVSLEQKEYEAAYEASVKASDVITLLMECISRDVPEAVKMADTLENYYLMVLELISQAMVKDDLTLCASAISSLHKMAATWRQVDQLIGAQQHTEPHVNLEEIAVNA